MSGLMFSIVAMKVAKLGKVSGRLMTRKAKRTEVTAMRKVMKMKMKRKVVK